jgi:hypothetical protein
VFCDSLLTVFFHLPRVIERDEILIYREEHEMMRKTKKSGQYFLVFAILVTLLESSFGSMKAHAALIGNVEMAGDAAFNSDSIADSSAQQPRWLSYPGSRLSLNANMGDSSTPPGALDGELAAHLGGWFKSSTFKWPSVVNTRLVATGTNGNPAGTVQSTWYPYKIDFNATYSGLVNQSLSGYDFFVDDNGTFVRYLQNNSGVPNDVLVRGTITGSGGAQWDSTNRVLLVSDANYYYAVHFVGLTADTTPVALNEVPVLGASTWSFRKHFNSGGRMAVSIGVASSSEGSTVAISRAKDVFALKVTDRLTAAKAYMDTQLRKAPLPSVWGFSTVNPYGVTAQQHRDSYYKAWTFYLQNYMKALPENAASFPYPQMMTGKPSLWNFGEPRNPGSAQWESLFGYQFLSYMMPAEAWNAYLGLMSLVDSNGALAGESLPTRKAQTAWMLYKNTNDLNKLQTVYPNLKRHLDWAEDHPYWFMEGVNTPPTSRDLDFVASWLFDVDFAIKIANELGITADITMWQAKKQSMIANMEVWFFAEPQQIYQYYDTITGPVSLGGDYIKISALAVNGLSSNPLSKLKDYFISIHNPSGQMSGFGAMKYPNASLTIYGLLNYSGHKQAKEFIEANLRDAIRAPDFAEMLLPGSPNNPTVGGVRPSLFMASAVIEFTWLLNGVRIDSGSATNFAFNSSAFSMPNVPNVMPTVEDFKNVEDWTERVNSGMYAINGAGTIFNYSANNLNYGYGAKQVIYDVDAFSQMTIKVDKVQGGWALKVNDGGVDIDLQTSTSQVGEFTYDLKAITGWSGTKTFKVKLFAVNGWVKADTIHVIPATVLEDFNNASDWTNPFNASISTTSGVATVSAAVGPYGSVRKNVTVNLTDSPFLQITVPQASTGTQWALKVNKGSGDINVQTDTSQTGTFTYDLRAITGWGGKQTFDILLYVVGPTGSSFKVDLLSSPAYTLEDFGNVSDWPIRNNAIASSSNGLTTLSAVSGPNGNMIRAVEYDLNRYPILIVQVPTLTNGAKWALKVNDGTGDKVIQGDTLETGTFRYNIPALTGWSSEKKFDIVLFEIGGAGTSMVVDEMRISNAP